MESSQEVQASNVIRPLPDKAHLFKVNDASSTPCKKSARARIRAPVSTILLPRDLYHAWERVEQSR